MLAMLALAAGFSYAHLSAIALVQSGEETRLQLLTKLIAEDIQNDLAATDIALKTITRDYLSGPVSSSASRDASSRMSALVGAIRGVRGMAVLDQDGKLLASSLPELVGQNFSQRDYFKTVKSRPDKNTLYLSAPFRSTQGEWVMAVARMVPDEKGRFAGVVAATLNQNYFSAEFRASIYAPDVWALVAHGDGQLFLNYPTKNGFDGTNLNRPETFFRRHLDRKQPSSLLTGTVYMTGEQRVMALRTIQPAELSMDHSLVIGLSRQQASIILPLRSQGWSYALLFTGIFLIGAASLWWSQVRRARRERAQTENARSLQEMQALQDSEARFRTLIEDAPLAIAILRAGRFIYTNPRYRALHGYLAGDDLSGLPWCAMIASSSLDTLRTQEALIEADSPIELMFEAQGLGKAGRLVPVFKTTARVMLADGPATLIFAQDISAQKKAEEEMLLARDAAQSANRSKAEFLANMSHEIRSPLNAILGLAYLLERVRLEPDGLEMVRKIRSAGQSLLGIISDILDVSKIEAGHMRIEKAQFKLAELIDGVAASMGIAAADKAIEVIVHPLPPGMSVFEGDALRLQQVLTNLTSNAIKFTSVGRVELVTQLARLDGDEAWLRFMVRDTGIGIPPAMQETIFSAFTQADTSTTRRFGGTGLGLTICRQLVKLMGGELNLRSTVGLGSDFEFTVPLAIAHGTSSSSPDMLSIRALIADDSEIALEAAGSTARAMGWEVQTVESGEAVLDYFQRSSADELPGVVLLDWKMPGLDGLATARALRETVSPDTPLIVLMSTAYSLSELVKQPGADVVDAFLSKPVTASNLFNAVMDARSQRSAPGQISASMDAGEAMQLAGIRVLVVDDSDINRDVVARILRNQGAWIEFANDGQAAVDWLVSHPEDVDLVLMDVQMPVMDGMEATRRLRRLPQFDDLPIVALTAGALKSQQEAVIAAGMSHFVSKPFDVPAMIQLIRDLCRASTNGTMPAMLSIAEATPIHRDNKVLDVEQGLQLWADVERYRQYLDRFSKTYKDAGASISVYLASGEIKAAGMLAHELTGVAASLAMPGLYRTSQEVERLVNAGASQAALIAAAESLRVELEQVMAAIPQIGINDAEASAHRATERAWLHTLERRELLVEMLKALDADDVDAVEAVLNVLSVDLPKATQAELWTQLRNFDLRGLEQAAKHLLDLEDKRERSTH
ncbi:hypothetical protein GCM10011396_10620 [Undibacterium terreum]|uniref:Virulence sensor protein BvgS n=1 Tax=Undibacterium terreum TaxID=1224302 RepID=A0A916U9H3_9BURK|nr:hypothetical protein GCM10011396_10620 [Undibacterium terreum]